MRIYGAPVTGGRDSKMLTLEKATELTDSQEDKLITTLLHYIKICYPGFLNWVLFEIRQSRGIRSKIMNLAEEIWRAVEI